MDAGRAETVLAGARKALFVMTGVLILLWALQLANYADGYHLTRGIVKFFAVTVIVVLTSGLAAWFFEAPHTVGAGASGVVFGYFGYIIVRGLFDRHAIDVLVGAVMALCFAYQFAVLLPQHGIGWQAHVGGLVGGIASGWLLRERPAARPESKPAHATVVSGTTTALPAAPDATATGSQSSKKSKGPVVDPANPRAELYKQLDEMGL